MPKLVRPASVFSPRGRQTLDSFSFRRHHAGLTMAQMRLFLLLGATLLAGACQSGRPLAQNPDLAQLLPPDETMGIDDVFVVRVYGEEDLSGEFRISDDGTVDYPFAGRIQVVGLRSGEVQRLIADKLKDGYLKNPQVSVMVKEWNSRKIAVLGQVQKPGSVVYFPRMTIVDAIAAAGGFTPIAAKNKVTLRREAKGAVKSQTLPVADISEGRSPNVPLLPGDVLVVEERLF
ncbi:MAG: polysaccharide export protein [Myxococcales bacterium]|nr:polysaccharide export protein [Myxococcales bacterium]